MQIQPQRLLLREFESADLPEVLSYQRDPRYLEFYPWAGRSEDDVRAFIQMFLDQQMENPRKKYQLVIALPGQGKAIGNCGIRRKPENDWEADIGYELNPGYWGNGYATEAAQAMVKFGFQELGLHRVASWCIADNTASVRVLERVGLRQEGRLRETQFFKGRWWDTLQYGLLEDGWWESPRPSRDRS